ncbi:MAG: hypothetical protein COT17_03505 [Elusimicrobia bacterium CG08_land_8_20_14_0_20_51_18]|nr:MAG: hypothetical protein COT17_03505 [Elusimicrobia bacterium CG08_land_8_20_14_0_20_51_18]
MEKLDGKLHSIKNEIEGVFSSIDPAVFDFKRNYFNPSGKAVRSRFTLLFSSALGLENKKAEELSICSELVHTSSLLHDDCIDGSSMRRGSPTINARFGVNTAILLGDLIMAVAFKRADSLSRDTSSELVAAVKKMAEGALLEENFKYKKISAGDYEKMVSLKTSALFRWSALSACYLSKNGLFAESSLIAEAFGLSFQITDDVIDLEEGADAGKERLKDITGGKITMPLLLALKDEKISAPLMEKLNAFLESGICDISAAHEMADLIRENGCLEKAREKAKALIEGVGKEILRLPEKNEAVNLYNYLYSLSRRKS